MQNDLCPVSKELAKTGHAQLCLSELAARLAALSQKGTTPTVVIPQREGTQVDGVGDAHAVGAAGSTGGGGRASASGAEPMHISEHPEWLDNLEEAMAGVSMLERETGVGHAHAGRALEPPPKVAASFHLAGGVHDIQSEQCWYEEDSTEKMMPPGPFDQ